MKQGGCGFGLSRRLELRHLSRFWGKGAPPCNLEALTHLGLILYRASHVDQALARIDPLCLTLPGVTVTFVPEAP